MKQGTMLYFYRVKGLPLINRPSADPVLTGADPVLTQWLKSCVRSSPSRLSLACSLCLKKPFAR